MSALYDDYKESCLGGGAHRTTDLTANEIRVGLVDTGTDYTFSAAHQDWGDIGAYLEDQCYGGEDTVVLTTGNITVTAGVFDCTDDQTFPLVDIDTAKTVDAIVHYAATGASLLDDPLISFHNAFVGGAVTPNGGDIVVAYHASGIFSL